MKSNELCLNRRKIMIIYLFLEGRFSNKHLSRKLSFPASKSVRISNID